MTFHGPFGPYRRLKHLIENQTEIARLQSERLDRLEKAVGLALAYQIAYRSSPLNSEETQFVKDFTAIHGGKIEHPPR
jgi:hypothetical protein